MRLKHRALSHRVPNHGKLHGRIIAKFYDDDNRPLFKVVTTDDAQKTIHCRAHELLPPPRDDPVSDVVCFRMPPCRGKVIERRRTSRLGGTKESPKRSLEDLCNVLSPRPLPGVRRS